MHKNQNEIMQIAINSANEAKAEGGVAIGSVLVDDKSGEIIASGGSLVSVTLDPTAHAEVNCIRSAAEKLGTPDLFGYTLYSTLEPCHMCLSAAAWAKIPRIYFGAYRKDVDKNLFDINGDFSDETEAARMNLRENTEMIVQGGVLEAECAALLDGYHSAFKHTEEVVKPPQKSHKKRNVVIATTVIVLVLGTIGAIAANKNQIFCDINSRPNGCPPPGMCDAPNDGWIPCDSLNYQQINQRNIHSY